MQIGLGGLIPFQRGLLGHPQREAPYTWAEHLRMALEELGAAFIKLGQASINPILFMFSILLILAWKTAGWIGLDRWLLPVVGTPWQPGKFFGDPVTMASQQAHECACGDDCQCVPAGI